MISDYDNDLCHDLYWCSDDLDLIFELMQPLVRVVLLSTMNNLDEDQVEEYTSVGNLSLFEALAHRKYKSDYDDPNHFYLYFYTTLRGDFLRSYYKVKHFVPETGSERMFRPARLIHPFDVERHIYLEQIPSEVAGIVIDRIRFDGNDLQACLYALSRILDNKTPVVNFMRRDLKVRDPEFLVSYVLVLVRSALYEMRLQSRPSFNYVFRYARERSQDSRP